jgi:penicillin-binding protein 1C
VKRWAIIAASVLALPILFWGAVILWPGDPPANGYGGKADLVVLASDGSVLGGLAHKQRRAGPWLGPNELTPLVKSAALAAEDKRFYNHPGVDPLAMARAAWQNLKAGRVVSGGSTITMQLARLERPAGRTLWAKLREATRALWIEARLDKDQILCQYLNRAPFGGPLVGLGAASRHLLGKSAERLSPAESALLMSLPKDPARLLKPSARPRLQARRDYILKKMALAGDLDQSSLNQALAAPIKLNPLPTQPTPAPHFIRKISGRFPPGKRRLVPTHLDPGLQKRLSSLVAATCRERQKEGLRQAAALVIRNSDRAVVAWVGSPDWHDPAGGQVDGVIAKRSPGSALKPFLYALALESGRTLADVIADEPMTLPVAGGAFRPVDYDGQVRGPVRLRIALASSLNLPALRLVREMTPTAFLLRLRKLGFALPKSADHYGLSLTLGDGEVSLLELTTAYAALAAGGSYQTPLLWQGQARHAPNPVISASAARLVADALADDRAREIGFGRHGVLELPFPAAVKTGTSQQHRDNWCIGFTKEFTVGVWVGNFQGKPMAGISGVTGAGPLWRQAMLLTHQGRSPGLPPWPPNMLRRQICSLSGTLPSTSGRCSVIEEVFAQGRTPTDTCPLHETKTIVESKSTRPMESKAQLDLLVPAHGAIYALDPDVPPELQVLALQAAAPHDVKGAEWMVDGKQVVSNGDPLEARLKLKPGRHVVELAAWGDWGRAKTKAHFTVLGGHQETTKR